MRAAQLLYRWRKLYWRQDLGVAQAILLAAFCVGAATVLRLALSAVGATLPFATYFPAVLIAALLGGRRSGFLAIPLSIFAAWSAIYDPSFSFARLDRVHVADFVVFSMAAGVVVLLAVIHRAAVFEVEDKRNETLLMAREVRHRSANLLTVVYGLVRQSISDPVEAKRLVQRIDAAVATDDLLEEAPNGQVDLKTMLQQVAKPYEGRISLHGPEIQIERSLAKALRLAFHEMATNALKYGALSSEDGHVQIRWRMDQGVCELDWRECNGPKVKPPVKENFGSKLIRLSLAQIGATLEANFNDDGYHYVIGLREHLDSERIPTVHRQSA